MPTAVIPKSRIMTPKDRAEIVNAISEQRQQLIDEITAADPDWILRVEERLKKMAMGKLKVEKLVQEAERLQAEETRIEEENEERLKAVRFKLNAVREKISAKMPKKRKTKRSGYSYKDDSCAIPMDVCEAVEMLVETLRPKIERTDDTAKKVKAIETEYQKRQERLITCETREDVHKAGLLQRK